MATTDVIVVGAGILGLSTAIHLADRGLSVVVLEREAQPAQHATGKTAGMIRHLYRHPQLTEWTRRSLALWPAPLRAAFKETGSRIIDRNAPDHHRELFIERELELERARDRVAVEAVETSNDGLIDPRLFAAALVDLVRQRSRCELKCGAAVQKIAPLSKGFAVQTSGELFEAQWVVNAAGAWVNRIITAETKTSSIQAQPFARHLFVVRGWSEQFMPGGQTGFFWDEQHGWYLRHWHDNTRLVSICDRVPANPDAFLARPETRIAVEAALRENLPQAVAEPLSFEDSWHCFRTYTEDQLPVWGEDPERPGLFWLAAFGGFGISAGYAAAFDAAEYIAGGDVRVSWDVLPERVKVTANSGLLQNARPL